MIARGHDTLLVLISTKKTFYWYLLCTFTWRSVKGEYCIVFVVSKEEVLAATAAAAPAAGRAAVGRGSMSLLLTLKSTGISKFSY